MTPRLISALADIATERGAPRLSLFLEELAFRGPERDDAICAVADELWRRKRDGLRSEVLAYRFDDERRSA